MIDFVSRIFGISSLEAAQKIASDFGISYDVKSAVTKPKKIICRKTDAQIYAEAEQRCFRVLSDYYHLLKKWEIDYAPNIDDETCHPLFVEAFAEKNTSGISLGYSGVWRNRGKSIACDGIREGGGIA